MLIQFFPEREKIPISHIQNMPIPDQSKGRSRFAVEMTVRKSQACLMRLRDMRPAFFIESSLETNSFRMSIEKREGADSA